MQYTTQQFIETMQRELQKRATTYPKIIKKQQGKWAKEELSESDILNKTIDLTTSQRLQVELLSDALTLYQGDETKRPLATGIFAELERERAMRKKVYPRLIYFKRITQETADAELAIWNALCEHFKANFL